MFLFDNLGVERARPGRVRLWLGGRARTETVVITGGTDEVSSPASWPPLSPRVEGEAGAGGGPGGTPALQAGVAHAVVTHRTLTALTSCVS